MSGARTGLGAWMNARLGAAPWWRIAAPCALVVAACGLWASRSVSVPIPPPGTPGTPPGTSGATEAAVAPPPHHAAALPPEALAVVWWGELFPDPPPPVEEPSAPPPPPLTVELVAVLERGGARRAFVYEPRGDTYYELAAGDALPRGVSASGGRIVAVERGALVIEIAGVMRRVELKP